MHQHDPPREFAYFRVEGALQKAFTDIELKLDLLFMNPAGTPALVRGITCKTISYRQLSGERIVVQTKPKGIFVPETIRFSPSRVLGGEVHLLHGKALSVSERGAEVVRTELNEGVVPGYYELQFLAHVPGEFQCLASPVIPVLVQYKKNNVCPLIVFGKHYDAPVERILDLPEDKWFGLAKPYPEGTLRILGPSMYEIARQAPAPECWEIRETTCQRDEDGSWTIPDEPPRKLLTLEGPLGDEPYSLKDDILRVTGRHETSQLLQRQLSRRRRLVTDPDTR
jgi:hypothetical protein